MSIDQESPLRATESTTQTPISRGAKWIVGLLVFIVGGGAVAVFYGPMLFASLAVVREPVVEVQRRAGRHNVDVCVGERWRYRWEERAFAGVMYSGETGHRVNAWFRRGDRTRVSMWSAENGALLLQREGEGDTKRFSSHDSPLWDTDRAEFETPLDPTDCDRPGPWLKSGESPLGWYYRNGGE